MKNQTHTEAALLQPRLVGRLTLARENLKWTQADLAKATGLQSAAISHFECGKRLPSLPNAVKLADALRVSLDWLTGRDEVTYYPSPNADGLGRRTLDDDSK